MWTVDCGHRVDEYTNILITFPNLDLIRFLQYKFRLAPIVENSQLDGGVAKVLWVIRYGEGCSAVTLSVTLDKTGMAGKRVPA